MLSLKQLELNISNEDKHGAIERSKNLNFMHKQNLLMDHTISLEKKSRNGKQSKMSLLRRCDCKYINKSSRNNVVQERDYMCVTNEL